MEPKELQRLFRLTMLIHKEKYAARILAALMKKSLSAQQICNICSIPPPQCYRAIKKLKENDLIEVVKKVVHENKPDTPVFFYKAQINESFVCIENGRFRVKLPAIFRLSNGREIELKSFFESQSSAS